MDPQTQHWFPFGKKWVLQKSFKILSIVSVVLHKAADKCCLLMYGAHYLGLAITVPVVQYRYSINFKFSV
jgi:hypothetical protein